MAVFDKLISGLESDGSSFAEKGRILGYAANVLDDIGDRLADDDRTALADFAFREADGIQRDLSSAADYREKDAVLNYFESLMTVVQKLYPVASNIPEAELEKMKTLADIAERERYLECAVEEMFGKGTIEKADVEAVVDVAEGITDEFQRGQLYAGIDHFKGKIGNMSDGAVRAIGEYMASEIKRYTEVAALGSDAEAALEYAVDVSRYFPVRDTADALYGALRLGRSNVSYYAVASLLELGRDVPADAVDMLAHDLVYAEMTYGMLKDHGAAKMFPEECTAPEYLAESDMVHWLTYPTELGEQPDAIEYLGKVTYLFKKDVYYIFRFRSDSKNLDDELRGQWLIGWSDCGGGTFSNFDRYDLYAGATPKKTLKNIKKKLLG